jgi:plastocyanin
VLLIAVVGWASLSLTIAGWGSAAGRAVIVNVTAGKPTENAFVLSPRSAKRGTVVFSLLNKGKYAHGFSINGRATKVVKPHATAKLKVVFKKPGKYVYQCVATAPPADFGPGYNDVPSDCGGGVFTVR